MIRVDTMRSLLHGQTDNFQIGRVQSIQITLANFLNANCKNLEFFLFYVQILEPKLNLNL